MADYIEREAFKEKLRKRVKNEMIRSWLCGIINEVHAADVAPVKHGQWEFLGPNRLIKGCMCGTCSVCKVRCKYIVNTDICPNCGAKMDEVIEKV